MYSPHPHLPDPEDACCKMHNPMKPKSEQKCTQREKEGIMNGKRKIKHTNEMMSRNWQPYFSRDQIKTLPNRKQKTVDKHRAAAK